MFTLFKQKQNRVLPPSNDSRLLISAGRSGRSERWHRVFTSANMFDASLTHVQRIRQFLYANYQYVAVILKYSLKKERGTLLNKMPFGIIFFNLIHNRRLF